MRIQSEILILLISFTLISSTCNTYLKSQSIDKSSMMIPTPKGEVSSTVDDEKGYSPYNTKTIIEPGRGTDRIFIGIDTENLQRDIGSPNESGEYVEPYLSIGCKPYSDMHWIQKPDNESRSNEGDGIYCFASNQQVFQISFSGPMYVLENGVGFMSKLKDVRKFYSGAKLYNCSNCEPGYRGSKPIQYLISADDGVAFEFFNENSLKAELLWRIYVFSPNSNFVPNGCLGGGRELTLQ